MPLNIKINFENTYPTLIIDKDLKSISFESELKNGTKIPLIIHISSNGHSLMPDVYNLSFGPLNENNQVDDQIKLTHLDYSKIFSTIVFEAMSFLKQNPNKYVGIDGSNNSRASLYYRCIQNNLAYLGDYFIIYGVNYYVRMLRQQEEGNYLFDTDDLKAIPSEIQSSQRIVSDKLYNYFIFRLKN